MIQQDVESRQYNKCSISPAPPPPPPPPPPFPLSADEDYTIHHSMTTWKLWICHLPPSCMNPHANPTNRCHWQATTTMTTLTGPVHVHVHIHVSAYANHAHCSAERGSEHRRPCAQGHFLAASARLGPSIAALEQCDGRPAPGSFAPAQPGPGSQLDGEPTRGAAFPV